MKHATNLRLVADRDRGPSERFLKLTRNPALESPTKFVPTPKQPGDIVL